MKKVWLAVGVAALGIVARGGVAEACGNSCYNSPVTKLVDGGNASSILGFNGDHAWADAWLYGSYDVVNNFGGGNTSCASTAGSSGCSSHYSAWYSDWGGTNCSNYSFLKCQYFWGSQLTYGITGVCHQSANRANAQFNNVPWVRYTSIAGGGTSYALYCNCGAGAFGCYSC